MKTEVLSFHADKVSPIACRWERIHGAHVYGDFARTTAPRRIEAHHGRTIGDVATRACRRTTAPTTPAMPLWRTTGACARHSAPRYNYGADGAAPLLVCLVVSSDGAKMRAAPC